MAVRVLGWVLVIYLGLGLVHIRTWRSEAAVWGHAYRVAPHSIRALVNLEKAQAVP